MRKQFTFILSLVALASLATAVGAATYTLFGEAALAEPGNASAKAVELRSDASPGFAGISFLVPAGTTFATLQKLSTDFNITDDDCKGGSPRFQIRVTTPSGNKNIFAYLGPAPSYSGCTPNTWVSSGDLLETPRFVDTTQLGGAFYHPYAAAVAAYGSLPVVSVQLVVDSGWAFADGEQTVLVDNVMINNDTYTFEDKDSCKKDGWKLFTSAPGPFKNQGDCVSYFSTGGRNPGNG